MPTLKIGDKAPDFQLSDKDGSFVSLSSLKAKYVVLFFYPKDDTPGCTIEAQEFSAVLDQFKRKKAIPIGISGGDDRSKQKFCKKHNLKVLLLSDPDFAVAEMYGVYGEKVFMGRRFKGIHRTTFVLDSTKKVVAVFERVRPAGHVAEVVEVL